MQTPKPSRSDARRALICGIALMILASGVVLDRVYPPFSLLLSDAVNFATEITISDRTLSSQATTYRDVAYCNSRDSRQTFDLYRPHSQDGIVPVVVFIHGGSWRYGDKHSTTMAYYAESLLAQGIAVTSVNYRLAPVHHYPSPTRDINCALDYLTTHADTYGIDPVRIGIMGDSAGANLAAMNVDHAGIRAFVGLYGRYDLASSESLSATTRAHISDYLDGAPASAASPIDQPVATTVRYRLYHGQLDRVVPPHQSQRYWQKLIDNGADAKLTIVRRAGHYFSARSQPTNTTIREEVIAFFSDALRAQP